MTDAPWHLGYRPGLDALRGIAILLVLAEHAGFTDGPAGGVGVTLFFVLSGFLITTLLIDERDATGRVAFGSFYRRRAVRLLPALALVLVASGAYLLVTGSERLIFEDLAPPTLYVANWAIIAGDLGVAGHMWSLSIEEQFYILWPVTIGLLARSPAPMRWLAGTVVAITIARPVVAITVGQLAARRATFTVADALLLGCLLAFAFRHRAWRPPAPLVVIAAATMVAWALIPGRDAFAIVGLSMVSLASTVLVAAGATSDALTWKPVVALGVISYGVYLWHWPLMYAFREYMASMPVALAVIALAIGVAAASYRYLERPILRRRPSRAAPKAAAYAHSIQPTR